MPLPLVVFFHRLGVRLYRVPDDEEVTELVEITSVNPPDIIENLSEFKDKNVYLLVSDSICQIFHHEFPRQEEPLTRQFIFEQVKDKFPQGLQSSNWDFKIISTDSHTIEIIVFALTEDFQSLISKVITTLNLKVNILEPESIAVTRHSNPVVGITLGKFSPAPTQTVIINETPDLPNNSNIKQDIPNNSKTKASLIILGLIIFILINFFLYQKYSQSISNPQFAPTPTISLSPSPLPTPTIQKTWSGLSLLIENGTSKAGYAGSIAVKFEEEGLTNVKTGNASRSDYSTSKLTFKSISLKESYAQRFINIYPVSETNIGVNSDLETDVVLTLGTN